MPWKSAIASIGVGLVNNALSQNNAQDQRDWQYMMWNEQNKYNHPAAQADRMRAAGLNPYLIQGAEPAGSVGTGATAQTIPLDNPLAYAKTFAEIDNLNATTTKIDTETDELLKRISLLELQKRYQVITNERFEREVKELFEEWDKRNPFTLEADKTESETAKNKTETEKIKSEQLLAEAEKNLTDAQAEYQRVLASNADSESKARVKSLLAQANASYAQAKASISLAEKYDAEVVNIDQHTWNMLNEEQRKAALHPYDLQLKQIAVEEGLTQSEMLKLQLEWQEFISRKDEDGNFTLSSVFAKFLLDNVYVSLSPRGKGIE